MPKTATSTPKDSNSDKTYLIPELDLRVSVAWLRLISWCQRNVPHGQVCYRMEKGEPTELVPQYTRRKVRFDKDEDFTSVPDSDKII